METRINKWAIYQGASGLYAMLLVETLEDAVDLLSYPVLKKKPERLPVVVNSVGGMQRFDPLDEKYVETRIVSEDELPLKLEERYRINSENFTTGFVLPDGTTVSCASGVMMECAGAAFAHYYSTENCFPEQALMKEHGWVSIFDIGGELYLAFEKALSKEQIEVVKTVGLEKFHPNIRAILRHSTSDQAE